MILCVIVTTYYLLAVVWRNSKDQRQLPDKRRRNDTIRYDTMASCWKYVAATCIIVGRGVTSSSAFPYSSRRSSSSTFVTKTSNQIPWSSTSTKSTTQLPMVFDFFKKRSEEGLDQIAKITSAASQGKLGEGLMDAATYTSETNRAFASGLEKSRNRMLNNLEMLFTGTSSNVLEELLDVLLQADLGMSTAEDVVAEVKSLQDESSKSLKREDLMSIMRGKIIESLQQESFQQSVRFADPEDKIPTVLFIMGANGMGKTTTIGKLAHRLKSEGNHTVLVAACDTFRAGAVEQLEQWADRAQVDCYGPSDKRSTPSAVLYGALDQAIAGNYDTLLVDTSGRLSNNDALTAELLKMKKVIQKRLSVETTPDPDGEFSKPILNLNVPHETLLVLDAAQGRMALDSAKVWDEEIGLTGLILTKLDGSARGGSVVAISRELKLPVKLIGVGEGIDDLRDVSVASFHVSCVVVLKLVCGLVGAFLIRKRST